MLNWLRMIRVYIVMNMVFSLVFLIYKESNFFGVGTNELSLLCGTSVLWISFFEDFRFPVGIIEVKNLIICLGISIFTLFSKNIFGLSYYNPLDQISVTIFILMIFVLLWRLDDVMNEKLLKK